ncbi:MAG: hypothetical protein EOP06_03475, partial [Proteobacteria bacterium]
MSFKFALNQPDTFNMLELPRRKTEKFLLSRHSFFLFASSLALAGCGQISLWRLSSLSATKPQIEMAASDKLVAQYGVAEVAITISEPLDLDTTFDFETQDATAKSGIDYMPASGRATLPAGQLSTAVNIAIIDKYDMEPNRKFKLVLKNVSNSAITSLKSADVEILNKQASGVPLAGIATLSVGKRHVCGVTMATTVKCWGENFWGQSGASTSIVDFPAEVPGLISVAKIATQADHTCALTSGGAVYCWGRNNYGQLGNGTTNFFDNATPVLVAGLSAVAIDVAVGANHACAVLISGQIECWGANGSGQLGDGSNSPRSSPVPVSGITTATHIAAGEAHTCAILAVGTVQCWGEGSYGRLGNGTTTSSNIPVDVTISQLSGVTSLATNHFHTCANTAGGATKCWGWVNLERSSSATPIFTSIPTLVSALGSGISAISTGGSHSCALNT